MEDKGELYYRIQEYLAGLLPEEERLDFEQQVQTDAALAAEVEIQRQLQEAILFSGVTDLQDRFDKLEDSIIARENRQRIRMSVLAAAALILIVILPAATWYYYNYTSSGLVARYLAPHECDLCNKGLLPIDLTSALNAYQQDDFETASRLLPEIRDIDPGMAYEIDLYTGVSLLLRPSPDPAGAIRYFDRILKEGYESLKDEAYWYKALALLSTGDKHNARITIEQKQQDDPKGYKYQESEDLREKLE